MVDIAAAAAVPATLMQPVMNIVLLLLLLILVLLLLGPLLSLLLLLLVWCPLSYQVLSRCTTANLLHHCLLFPPGACPIPCPVGFARSQHNPFLV
jgi:hypothetical protein